MDDNETVEFKVLAARMDAAIEEVTGIRERQHKIEKAGFFICTVCTLVAIAFGYSSIVGLPDDIQEEVAVQITDQVRKEIEDQIKEVDTAQLVSDIESDQKSSERMIDRIRENEILSRQYLGEFGAGIDAIVIGRVSWDDQDNPVLEYCSRHGIKAERAASGKACVIKFPEDTELHKDTVVLVTARRMAVAYHYDLWSTGSDTADSQDGPRSVVNIISHDDAGRPRTAPFTFAIIIPQDKLPAD